MGLPTRIPRESIRPSFRRICQRPAWHSSAQMPVPAGRPGSSDSVRRLGSTRAVIRRAAGGARGGVQGPGDGYAL